MTNFGNFYQLIAKSNLSHWLETLPKQLSDWKNESLTNQVKSWYTAINYLPEISPANVDLKTAVSAFSEAKLTETEKRMIEMRLRMLMPWRKGPYSLYGVDVDTEWRSDWKWQRLLPHITPLKNRLVLDVGCGNGYHLWRMIGEGAKMAVGIDPTSLFLCQFEAVRKLMGGDQRAHLLPLGIEQLPELAAFDSVFSMGVLYHRRSPLDHLLQLKNQLVDGGELILDTMVIEGDENQVLVPGDRYAKMVNVYFIPSTAALTNWLAKCGFVNIRIADISVTTIEEQRKTDWIKTESLQDFLCPGDHTKTVEGYPAPMRAVITANKP